MRQVHNPQLIFMCKVPGRQRRVLTKLRAYLEGHSRESGVHVFEAWVMRREDSPYGDDQPTLQVFVDLGMEASLQFWDKIDYDALLSTLSWLERRTWRHCGVSLEIVGLPDVP